MAAMVSVHYVGRICSDRPAKRSRAALSLLPLVFSADFAGCAGGTNAEGPKASAEPIVLEYRTGTTIGRRGQTATTEEEAERTRQTIDAIRTAPKPGTVSGRP